MVDDMTIAKQWTEQYAKPGALAAEQENKIKKIVEMGFDAAAARSALESKRWDEAQALEYLLTRA
jgi:ubiquitin-conjugating enzyme (huntingtin interacting protein 2)